MRIDYDLGMKWNDRLKLARDAAGLANTEIARACKVSDPTVTGWMTGKTVNIEARFLLPLCKLLKVSPFYVMFGEEVPGMDFVLPGTKVDAMDAIRLMAWFAQSTDEGRAYILDAAKNAKKL